MYLLFLLALMLLVPACAAAQTWRELRRAAPSDDPASR